MKGKILVVDREISDRGFLRELLEEEGYQVTTRKDGHRIIELLEEEDFDVLLLDLGTPGVTGAQLYRDIRKANPKVHIILMTARFGDDLVKEGMDLGAYGCIHKPFDTDEILTMLRHVIPRNGLEKW